jgi:hypothetical protein
MGQGCRSKPRSYLVSRQILFGQGVLTFYDKFGPCTGRWIRRSPAKSCRTNSTSGCASRKSEGLCVLHVVGFGLDMLTFALRALQELKARMEALMVRHATANVARLHRASAAQTQLTHRLMNLVLHLHLLIPSLRSSAITPEEESLWAALEDTEDEIKRRRVGGGKMRAKLNELWALVSAFQAARDRDRSLGKVGFEWAVVDEDSFAQITQVRHHWELRESLTDSCPANVDIGRATGEFRAFDQGLAEGCEGFRGHFRDQGPWRLAWRRR